MKNVLARIGVLVALLLATMSVAFAAGPDIIENGDFSSGLAGWDLLNGSAEVGNDACGAEILYMETAGVVVGSQVNVQQCINIITPPSGTWTFSVGQGDAFNQLSLNANYRFSNQPNCIGASTGGPFTSITTFPGSVTNIPHPNDAQSVQIDLLLTEGFDGAATACMDDVSFVDSGGSATVLTLTDQAANAHTPITTAAWLAATIGLVAVSLIGLRKVRQRG